ncbi:MAG: nucleoside 2-deoxyribosyltransferase domain-containing protein [Polyangiaceae bacterium]
MSALLTRKPPGSHDVPTGTRAVFLAGSIDMGAAEDWQAKLVSRLEDLPVVALNPRRDAWDASWVQRMANAEFRAQVEWELDGLALADVVAMWFAPESRAPITLLELGLTAPTGKLVVGCPDGFYRKGNVEIVCARYGVPLLETFDAFVAEVRARLARA